MLWSDFPVYAMAHEQFDSTKSLKPLIGRLNLDIHLLMPALKLSIGGHISIALQFLL